MKIITSKTKILQDDIEKYVAVISRTLLVFPDAIAEYLKGEEQHFKKHVHDILTCEHDADTLQRSITFKMYAYMLMPDSQADVLDLITQMDDIPDTAKKVIENFDLERPDIPEIYVPAMIKLATTSVKTAEALMHGIMAYFSHDPLLKDHVNKVLYFEHEADQIQNEIKRDLFKKDNDLELARKIQIRYFCEKIALLSDTAENISDKLTVYSIKHML